jgi:DNA-binding MarR family transcriptional regulator
MTSDAPLPPSSSLHDQTSYWLDRLRSLIHARLEEQLAEFDVTLAQWNVLVTVHRSEANMPGDIARFIDIDAGALTRLIDRLVAKDLIRRVPAPGDRRSLHLELTDKALGIMPELSKRAATNEEAFFGGLTGREQRRLRKILAKLLANHDIATPKQWRKHKAGKLEREPASTPKPLT